MVFRQLLILTLFFSATNYTGVSSSKHKREEPAQKISAHQQGESSNTGASEQDTYDNACLFLAKARNAIETQNTDALLSCLTHNNQQELTTIVTEGIVSNVLVRYSLKYGTSQTNQLLLDRYRSLHINTAQLVCNLRRSLGIPIEHVDTFDRLSDTEQLNILSTEIKRLKINPLAPKSYQSNLASLLPGHELSTFDGLDLEVRPPLCQHCSRTCRILQ